VNPASPSVATEPPAGRGLLIESLLLAAVALVALNFHPFGSAHLRRHFSQDLVYAWFGNQQWLYPRAARPRTVVILVDDEALALRGARWPVPAAFHAQLLAELEVLRPRAVMLDFLLLDRAGPEDACALLATADRLRREHIPIYVAVTRRADLALLEVVGCSSGTQQPLTPAQVFIPVAVRRQVDEADFMSRRYPFADAEEPTGAGPPLPSAAVRMYCDTTAAADRCPIDLRRGQSPDAGFELAWSPAGDPFNERWSATRCRQTSATRRIVFDRAMMPGDSGCPPIATLFASALLSPAEDPALGPDNEQLFDLLADSFVFVGGDFRGSGDLITTPMHTQLPGVYYHAAAFDNLVVFAGKPKIREEFRSFQAAIYLYDLSVLWALAGIFLVRERLIAGASAHGAAPWALSASARAWLARGIARTPVWLSLGVVAAGSLLLAAYPVVQGAALAAAVVCLIGLEVRVMSQLELKARVRSLGIYAAALASSLLVVAVAIWFGYRWLRLPPGDWAGYLSFSFVGFFVAHTAIVDFGRHVGSMRGHGHSGGETL
jgi:hypothetical protein